VPGVGFVKVSERMGGLRQAAGLVRPSALAVLRQAGVVEPRSVFTLLTAMPRLVGRGGTLGLISHVNARAVGATPAVHDRRGTLTWRDLDRRANRFARAMARLGVRPGQRVATVLRNGREMVEVLFGAQKLGVVACPLNTWAKPAELRAALEGAEPRLLIHELAHEDQVRVAAPEGLPRVAVGETTEQQAGTVPYEELLAGHSDRPLGPFTRDRGSAQIVIHTSGTTGKPKGASRDAANQGVRSLTALLEEIPLQRRDVILCPAPLFHAFGLLALTLGSLLGATLVFPERFDPEECLALIERHAATACAFVPVMLNRIVSLPAETRSRCDLSSVRIVLVSGSSLPGDLRDAAGELFGPVLHDLYGSTEAGWVAVARPEDMAEHPGTVGRPVPGVEVAVLGDDDEPVPSGQVGNLHVRSDAVFQGYTGGEKAQVRDGYLSLGDLGKVDRDGYLYVEGRADDMVVIGGENVYPAEVEAVIRKLNGVDEVAVAGVPDPEYGQVLAAFVVGSADQERVVEACREALASYKVPRRVEHVDRLPRNATGKVLVRELIDRQPEKE
jgi:acyl-CoA synthetase (AMP-forming)/AMP-acid ligase II